ncbi:MAG: hypothetical protein V7646_2546 [Pseudonocardia sp.]|jgi:methionine synthase II (cobalamin-independent)
MERSPRALRLFTTVERRSKEILITPDCGLLHVPAHAARAKMLAMATAAAAVRDRIQKEKNT